MDLQHFQTFCTVISEGNMTRAATKLSITQPTVSQQIRQIEKHLNVKLLTRNARKIKLTVQGQLFYETANKILNIFQQTKTSLQALSLNLSNENIYISTINSIGLHLISPVIDDFLKLNSKICLSLLYGSGETVIQRMQKNLVDLVIMPDLRQEYGKDFIEYEKQLIFKDPLYFVGSGKNKNLPKSISFKDIASYQLIQFEHHYFAFQNHIQKQAREHGISLKPSFQCDNAGTIKRAIESGLGCGFLPAHCIHKQLRFGRLKIINIENFNYSVDINFYTKPATKKTKIIDILKLLIHRQMLAII